MEKNIHRKTNTKGWKNTSFEIPEEINLLPKEIRNFLVQSIEFFSLVKGTKDSDKYLDSTPAFGKAYDQIEKSMKKLKERIK